MGPKTQARAIENRPREGRDGPSRSRVESPAMVASVQRRGNDAILDSDDCEIIVYELFGDRA